MVNSHDVRRAVIEAIAAAAEVGVAEVTEDRDIFELGLDSLDFWSVLMDVEERVGTEVPSGVLDGLAAIDGDVTVGRLLDVVSGWAVTADSAQV